MDAGWKGHVGHAWNKRYAVDGSALMHAVKVGRDNYWVTVCTGSRATREYAGNTDVIDCRVCTKAIA